jgi:tol-pal system protein YbgF
MVTAACHKEPPPPPAPVGPSAAELERARQDSIARVRARTDSAAAAQAARARAEADRLANAQREMRATLERMVNFDYDEAAITPAAEQVLREKADILRANPGVQIRVEGHADERGSTEYNQALGSRRAEAVKGFFTLAVALLASAGCATKGDLRRLGVEINSLNTRQDSLLAALTRQNTVTQDSLRRQGDALFDVRGDLSRQLQRILDELATLRELTGQNQRTIASVRDQIELLQRGGGGAPRQGEAIVGTEPGVSAGAGGAPVTAAEAMYDAAVQQYTRGSLATALRAFNDFLEKNANHALAPDARYYVGDILAQQSKPQDAIAAFAKIQELHPTSPKVPDALYRIGLIHLELGNKTEAKRFLDRVVNTYPDSNAAGLAREKVKEIK